MRSKQVYMTLNLKKVNIHCLLHSDIIVHRYLIRQNLTQISSTNKNYEISHNDWNYYFLYLQKGWFRSYPHYCQRVNFKIELHFWSFTLIQHVYNKIHISKLILQSFGLDKKVHSHQVHKGHKDYHCESCDKIFTTCYWILIWNWKFFNKCINKLQMLWNKIIPAAMDLWLIVISILWISELMD